MPSECICSDTQIISDLIDTIKNPPIINIGDSTSFINPNNITVQVYGSARTAQIDMFFIAMFQDKIKEICGDNSKGFSLCSLPMTPVICDSSGNEIDLESFEFL
jgi:hypothetical protein